MKSIDILIADDHDLVLEGFKALAKKLPFVSSVHGVSNGEEVLKYLTSHRPHLILMDLNMPKMDGFDTSKAVLAKYPDIKIIILSSHNEDEIIFHMIEAGVQGYMVKHSKPKELQFAIEEVMSKGFFFNEKVIEVMRKGIVLNSKNPVLTAKVDLNERDKKLLKLISQEKTSKEIADDMHLSPKSIEKMRAALASKLDVKGTVGLVRYAVRNGYDL